MELLSEDHSDTSSTQDMSHSTITTIKSSLVAHEMKEFGLIHNTTTQSSKGGPPPRSSPMTTRAADRFRHVAHPQGTYYPKFIAT
jgi:hypothetical protein